MNSDKQCCYSASCPLERVKWGKKKKWKNAALDSAENVKSKRHLTHLVTLVFPKFNLLICDFIFYALSTSPHAVSLTHFITKLDNKIDQTLFSQKHTLMLAHPLKTEDATLLPTLDLRPKMIWVISCNRRTTAYEHNCIYFFHILWEELSIWKEIWPILLYRRIT